MSAASGRHIIVADEDLSRLDWLVAALRAAGHAVFPVMDAEGALSIARALDRVDLLVVSPDLPSVSGRPFREVAEHRLREDVRVVYWNPTLTGKAEAVEQLLAP